MNKATNKSYKGILIDPETRSIRELIIKDGADLAALLGCEFFEGVIIDDKNILYVDDSGMVNGTTTFFTFNHPSALPIAPNYPNVSHSVVGFRGKGLILGYKPNGDTASTSLDVEKLDEENRISLAWECLGNDISAI